MTFQFTLRSAAATLAMALAYALPVQAAGVAGQGTWETTLLGRDIDRNAVAATDTNAVYLYDTTLGVTWLRMANFNGQMNWDVAMNWASNLSTGIGSKTVDDWRLPTMAANPNPSYSVDGSTAFGFNVPAGSSEIASLFYSTLGNKAYFNTFGIAQAGYGLTNTGSFQDMRSDGYWLGTEYAQLPNVAWYFNYQDGIQAVDGTGDQLYAMAVRPGDVLLAPVPEQETYAMLLAGLGLLGAVARRRKSNQA